MRKPLGVQKCDGRTDGPTDRHSKVQSRVFATNKYREIDDVKQTEKARDIVEQSIKLSFNNFQG